MPKTRILDAHRNCMNVARLIAGVLLVALAAAPLHAQTYIDLHDLSCDTGGCEPINFGQLAQGSDGNFYATTSQGGFHQFGTIFQLTPSGVYTDLWQFDGISGGNPFAALALASDGNFYGTTTIGGSFDSGVLFQFSPTPFPFYLVLHNFSSGEGSGFAPPVQGKDGNLYGLTGNGIAYRVTLPAGTYQQLPTTVPLSGGQFVLASDGNLYSAAFGGGGGYGFIFRMTTTGVVSTLHNFNGSDGAGPVPPLFQAADGNLYGATNQGGANGTGTVFKMTLAGQLTTLHSFDANPNETNNDGANPSTGVLPASDGLFYGTTLNGGAMALGTIFRVTSNGIFTKLFDFNGNVGPVFDSAAFATLVQHTSGTIYGLTAGDNANDFGNAYELTIPNLSQILKVAGPIFVLPGTPVQILGNNLSHVVQVNFGSVQADFQPGSDTFLTATVPTQAIDAPISVFLDTGLQVQTQMAFHIIPLITNLDPSSGPVGTVVNIAGGGFAGAKKVTFGGAKARFSVVAPNLIQAVVPSNAKTGKVKVTTPNGTATSRQKFTVM